jgi:hypothetical protein
MWNRFWHSFFAVVIGNAIYFALLPHLPPRAQHKPMAIDWGLAVDFWLCLLLYGLIELGKKAWQRRNAR